MLLDVMAVEQTEDLKMQHLGNLVWSIAKFCHPNSNMKSYTDFADMLEGKSRLPSEETIEAWLDNMVETFLPKDKRGELQNATA